MFMFPHTILCLDSAINGKSNIVCTGLSRCFIFFLHAIIFSRNLVQWSEGRRPFENQKLIPLFMMYWLIWGELKKKKNVKTKLEQSSRYLIISINCIIVSEKNNRNRIFNSIKSSRKIAGYFDKNKKNNNNTYKPTNIIPV